MIRSSGTHAASSFERYRMITTLFLGFVALMAAVVVALSARYLNGRTAFAITAGLFVWLIYVGLLHGMGSGVFEIALPFKGDAFRVVYAVQLADEIWVVHAFQKKSTQGIKTPKREIDLIKDRLKRLKEMLR